MKRPSAFFTYFLILFFSIGCNLHRLFYYPNRNLYVAQEKPGMAYDLVQYPSLNGKKLTAIVFHTDQKPKGTIVHFHGNFGNVSNHFLQSQYGQVVYYSNTPKT